jgi:YVTN family beta-propeller protein
MKNNKLVLLALAIGIMFTSCSEDNDDNVEDLPKGDYDNGILISHEGNYFQGNASISYVSDDFETVENNVFSNVNGSLLGDTAQSMAFSGELAYIVVNVSNKVEVVDRYSFESVATIESGLVNPRYMAILDGYGYVTNWGDGGDDTDDYVAVIDLTTNAVLGTIAVGEGPEQILATDDNLYVSHKGGWSTNNIVSVIDSATYDVETVTVDDVPDEMIINSDGDLVVLCEGATEYDASYNVTGHTDGSITKIDVSDNSIISTLSFSDDIYPSLMAYSDGTIYYQAGGEVYSFSDDATSLPTESIISDSFYNMSVKDGMLYGVDVKDYVSNGDLTVYDLSTNTLTQTITVNIIPGGVYFN